MESMEIEVNQERIRGGRNLGKSIIGDEEEILTINDQRMSTVDNQVKGGKLILGGNSNSGPFEVNEGIEWVDQKRRRLSIENMNGPLQDLIGHPFTWERNRGEANWIEVRLDRALVSSSWALKFPLAKLFNLAHSSSDHSPIFLEPVGQLVDVCNRKFKFENAWLKEPLCQTIVSDNWISSSGLSISSKIHNCAEKLVVWGKSITGDFKGRIKNCKKELN
uniref:Uncharacterized protein n=1 Tax=Cannabis sativa TaxID=3483 RepID=A0A803QAP8_CANSA